MIKKWKLKTTFNNLTFVSTDYDKDPTIDDVQVFKDSICVNCDKIKVKTFWK